MDDSSKPNLCIVFKRSVQLILSYPFSVSNDIIIEVNKIKESPYVIQTTSIFDKTCPNQGVLIY